MSDGPLPALLLAAGGSTRMGRPKQLLAYRGRTLVWHAASTILSAGFLPLHVVAGNEAIAVSKALADLPVKICRNNDWAAGIGSSIRVGVATVSAALPSAAGILITLADQPGVSADHLRALRAKFALRHIIASRYAGEPAVPAIFPRVLFEALQTLPDAAGGKSLMKANRGLIQLVDLPDFRDIDHPEDYETLVRLSS